MFLPRFSGQFKLPQISQGFLEKLYQRIDNGLFSNAPKSRNNYNVVSKTENSLHFQSSNILSSIYIGLNDVKIELNETNSTISFTVSYWGWAKYCIFLSLFIGIFIVSGYFLLSFSEGSSHTSGPYFFPFVMFFCIVWPWLLIRLHRGPARKRLIGILSELNETPKST